MKTIAAVTIALTLTATACAQAPVPFISTPVAEFNEPWALEFLPDGRLLITEKSGTVQLVTQDGKKTAVTGTPKVAYGGQGGLGDIKLHPDFANNHVVYISYVEAGDNKTSGAVVGKGTLDLAKPAIEGFAVIWRALPKLDSGLHFSHRLLLDNDGHLFVSAGERNHNAEDPANSPAQDVNKSLGKTLRLDENGKPAAGNPFASQEGIASEVWSMGHRNPLGIAFDPNGQLWDVEMGPRGGDELNMVQAGANYGYPYLSNGNHYNGKNIPDHDTDSAGKYAAPKVWWNPVISPSSLIFYSGEQFPSWKGNAFISGLSSQAIIRVSVNAQTGAATEAERFAMGKRMRGLKQGPDGNLWAIEDGAGGRLLKLSPRP
jgi:aldose sugar dehydrogenase